MAYGCKILADSMNPDGNRLISLEVNMPKFLVAQYNTHRAFSRNSASSRAVPVSRMIERVKEDPFIPDVWGSNKRGMQAGGTIEDQQSQAASMIWHNAMHTALEHASRLSELNVHKQLANRLLEPFMWTTVLVTATDWDNFFRLRLDHAAQPEMQRVAQTMRDAIDASNPVQLGWGQWHYPYPAYIPPGSTDVDITYIMAARAARLSYLSHNGNQSAEDDIRLGKELWEQKHLSPFEHSAKAYPGRHHNLNGWHSLRAQIEHGYQVHH